MISAPPIEPSALGTSLQLLRLDRLPIFVFQDAAKIAELACALQEFAAIHADDFPVDVARTVTHKKSSQVGQLFYRAEAVQGVAVERDRFEAGMRQHAGKRALRWYRAGSDGVHANATIAPFDGEAPSKRFDSGFGDRGGH